MKNDPLIRMQKNIAMGGSPPEGDFGVEKMADMCCGTHPDQKSDVHSKKLADGERGPPINHTKGKLGSQSNPDHGPVRHK